MITNNISLAWNDIVPDPNASQQYINHQAAFMTQDPELMFIAANSAKLPQVFQSLKPVLQEKQYQSALNKIAGQLTPVGQPGAVTGAVTKNTSRTTKSVSPKKDSPSTTTSLEPAIVDKPKTKK